MRKQQIASGFARMFVLALLINVVFTLCASMGISGDGGTIPYPPPLPTPNGPITDPPDSLVDTTLSMIVNLEE